MGATFVCLQGANADRPGRPAASLRHHRSVAAVDKSVVRYGYYEALERPAIDERMLICSNGSVAYLHNMHAYASLIKTVHKSMAISMLLCEMQLRGNVLSRATC